jgi:hypothetical protein
MCGGGADARSNTPMIIPHSFQDVNCECHIAPFTISIYGLPNRRTRHFVDGLQVVRETRVSEPLFIIPVRAIRYAYLFFHDLITLIMFSEEHKL